MRVLITGGAGFIGSNIADTYLAAGHEVSVLDDLSSGSRGNLPQGVTFHELDIRSPEAQELVATGGYEIVNHHAAQISVPRSVTAPMVDAEINLVGLLNILEGARRGGVRKMLFASSGGSIYGEAAELPTSESAPPCPRSPYAVAKRSSELYLDYYKAQFGLDYTVLRYANVYGPRQVPESEAGVVCIFMSNLLAGKDSLLFHYPEAPDGMTRDYVYVGDVAKANLAALTGPSGVFNVATQEATSTGALYRALHASCPTELPPSDLHPAPARPGDLANSCLSNRRAVEAGLLSELTPLHQGLKHTWAWRIS